MTLADLQEMIDRLTARRLQMEQDPARLDALLATAARQPGGALGGWPRALSGGDVNKARLTLATEWCRQEREDRAAAAALLALETEEDR